MTMPQPEFSRPIRLDTIGEKPHATDIEASPAECAALAARFGLEGVSTLRGHVALAKTARGIAAHGRITAAITQICVATGDPVPESIDTAFELLFVTDVDSAEELELDADDLDIVEHDGQVVDIGEALAQTLAVSMEPFPRSKDADAKLRGAGVISEEEAGPFGALAGLKQALEKKD